MQSFASALNVDVRVLLFGLLALVALLVVVLAPHSGTIAKAALL